MVHIGSSLAGTGANGALLSLCGQVMLVSWFPASSTMCPEAMNALKFCRLEQYISDVLSVSSPCSKFIFLG